MTTINNYDNCSTMTNCELTCFLATDISCMDWEENFERIGSADHLFFYTDCGSEPTPNDVVECLQLKDVTEKEARQFALNYDKCRDYQDLRNLVEYKQEMNCTWVEYACIRIREKMTLEDCVNQRTFPDLGRPLYEFVSINGYVQRDFATVMYKPTDGFLTDPSAVKKHFTNLFYDSPAYCRLMVDGEEYHLTEGLNDTYQWDPEEIVCYAKESLKLRDDVLAWLSEKLPAQLVA